MSGGGWRAGWAAFLVSTVARVVLAALVALLLVSVVPAIAGWQTSVVMSGSMTPTLQPGDLVVVRPVDAAALHKGQIVLVDDPDVPGELRIHRITAVETAGLRLRGDANPQADGSLVARSAVHGVGTLRLPALGRPVLWLRDGRTGPLLLTGLGLLALLGLALLHRERTPSSPPLARSGRAPGRGQRLRAAAPRLVALGSVGLAVAVLPGADGARAVFNSVTGNSGDSFAAGTYWSCANAASAAGASQYYPLQESVGTTAANSGTLGSAANATYSTLGVTYAFTPGPRCAVGQQSAAFLDGSSGVITANNTLTNPQTFTIQLWFGTNTTSGGKLMGFGDGRPGNSGNYDRHIYMLNTGQLAFGVYNGTTSVVTSAASYNDSRWHLATATFSPTTGMTLYVDGVQVGRNASVTAAQNYTGSWRIGYDNLSGWPNAPLSEHFYGAVAHAAVFPSVLSASEVANQAGAGPWTCAAAAGVNGSEANVYLPLQESSGTTAANAGTAGAGGNGTYSASGWSSVLSGPNCGINAFRAIQLDGVAGQVWTTQAVTDPEIFTVQIWFNTTTTTGGRLIGFGNGAGGAASTNFDRLIFMSNNGTLTFGVYNGGHYTIATPTAYNDGTWHLATGTFSPGTGMAFYVDGTLIGTNTQTTSAQVYTGYWRIGYDSPGSWPGAPSDAWFTGKLAQASVYYRVLTADEVAGQYLAGK